jgi:5-methylcytosine-specific restriction endonuclease McrA
MSVNINMSSNENPVEITETNIETNTETIQPKKKGKEKIPVPVKNALWSLHFQTNLNGVCQCCKTETISRNNFDCGHIVSEKEGGNVELTNLRPICRACNSSMGVMNMNEYMKKYGFDKIEKKTDSKTDSKTESKTESKTDMDKIVKEKKVIKDDKVQKEKEEKLMKDKQEKDEEKLIKDTEKLEKQFKDSMESALKLQKDADAAMENAKVFQTEYMAVYNQILSKCKNDDLKKICQTLKMSKTGYANKEEYLKSIFEYLNEKSINDIKEICKEFNIKGKNIISIIYYLSKNYVKVE